MSLQSVSFMGELFVELVFVRGAHSSLSLLAVLSKARGMMNEAEVRLKQISAPAIQ